MAIAFDSAMTYLNTGSNPGSPVTSSFTNSAGNLGLFGIEARSTSSADVGTGFTYGGVSATLVQKSLGGSEGNSMYVYYLNSPATGSNTCSWSYTGTVSGQVRMGAISYSGCATNSTVIDNSQTKNNLSTSAGSATDSITPSGSNTWAVWWFWQAVSGTQAAGTNATLRGSGTNTDPGFFDSNGTITGGASYSMTATWVGGSDSAAQSIMLTIAPPAAVVTGYGSGMLMRGV